MVGLGLELLKYRASPQRRGAAWAQKLPRLSTSEQTTVLTYLAEVGDADEIAAWLTQLPLPEAQMGTMAERWFQQGIEKGIQKGLEQGLEAGIEKGIEKGQRDTLRALLRLKFGADADAWAPQLDTASRQQLARWTARILTAQQLADVFHED